LPIQFLALTGDESRESQTIREAARSLDAEVNLLTVDERDIDAIEAFAERRAARGIAGESSRWQEAGYWLTPVLALLVALSFRKQTKVTQESAV
jgi:Ca-activated chloride channel family protein